MSTWAVDFLVNGPAPKPLFELKPDGTLIVYDTAMARAAAGFLMMWHASATQTRHTAQ